MNSQIELIKIQLEFIKSAIMSILVAFFAIVGVLFLQGESLPWYKIILALLGAFVLIAAGIKLWLVGWGKMKELRGEKWTASCLE